MRKPYLNPEIFKQRRKRLAALIPGSAVILPSWPETIRNADGHFNYRQESNMLYLSGFDEPGSCLIFRPGQKPETVLFVRQKNIERETWDGFRYGPEGAKQEFGVDEAYPIKQLEEKAPQLLKDCEKVYYSMFRNEEFDEIFGRVMMSIKWLRPRAGLGVQPIEDAYGLLGELRIRKTEEDIEIMRRAGSISARAHVEVMNATKPGGNERALHGLFIKSIMEQGAYCEAYTGIFAGGVNACTLHYRFNEDTLKDGDLFLVDAGAEYLYHSGDITRTFPVNGKFSVPQKRIYQAMLDLQLQLINMIKPGLVHSTLQEKTIEGIAKICLEERLLTGTVDEIIQTRSYMKYYPHGVSHLLGMDTHDAGALLVGGRPRAMEPGWVFTVEPGIYIPPNDTTAPAELRGIGIRIEDDVVCTETGVEVLTSEVPKDVAGMEAVIGRS
jgi:Xaa-Pro aminopeptidase